MDLDTINKSLRQKEDWNIPCLTIDLYDDPAALQSSIVLPRQHDLTKFFPNELNQYLHQGGGIDVSVSDALLLIFRANSHLYSQLTDNALLIPQSSVQRDKRLWFPSEFSDAPSICREINNQSCFKGGYELVCDTTSKSKKFTKTALRCQCHSKPKKSRGQGKKMTQSTKPQDDNATCGMYFNIFKDNTTGQYYIRQNGGHNLHHSGHPPIQKELKEAVKRHLSTSAIDEARKMIDSNIDPSIIQEMINYKHGVNINKTSIQKMREAFLMEEFEIDSKNKQTTAQILLNWLDGQADVDYVAYYGSYQQAEDTVKVRKQRKKGKRTKVATRKKVGKATDSSCPLAAVAVDGKESNHTIPADTQGETGVIDVPAPEQSNTALAEDPDICKSLDETIVYSYKLP